MLINSRPVMRTGPEVPQEAPYCRYGAIFCSYR